MDGVDACAELMQQHVVVAGAVGVDALAGHLECGHVLGRHALAHALAAAIVVVAPEHADAGTLQDVEHVLLGRRADVVVLLAGHLREHARYRNRRCGSA